MYGPLTADGIHSHDCPVISPCLTTSGQSHLPAHIASKVKFTEESTALEAVKPKGIYNIWRKLSFSIPKHFPIATIMSCDAKAADYTLVYFNHSAFINLITFLSKFNIKTRYPDLV